MRRDSQVALQFTVGLCCLFMACSDSPKPKPVKDAGGEDSGSNPDASRSDGSVSDGSLKEGELCESKTECGTGLSCINTQWMLGTTQLKICARACKVDNDCGSEACVSGTGDAADLHCENVVRTLFGKCGIGDTSFCGNRTCLYYQNTLGTCVDICPLPPLADGGVPNQDDAGDDAGAITKDAGTPSNTCGQLSCVSGVIDSPTMGVCASVVKRGDVCAIESGKLCAPEDLCAHDDPSDAKSPRHCYEDCTSTGMCAKGSCTDINGQVAYCL